MSRTATNPSALSLRSSSHSGAWAAQLPSSLEACSSMTRGTGTSGLVVEHLRHSTARRRNEVLVNQREDVVTDFGGVLPRVGGLLFTGLGLALRLHAGDDAPDSPSTPDGVLALDVQLILLLDRELCWLFTSRLHTLRYHVRKLVRMVMSILQDTLSR